MIRLAFRYVFLNFFFYNDTATTEIYTLSLHDALPISSGCRSADRPAPAGGPPSCACSRGRRLGPFGAVLGARSEEHTSELQSHSDLVCRLLLEKKKRNGTSGPYMIA